MFNKVIFVSAFSFFLTSCNDGGEGTRDIVSNTNTSAISATSSTVTGIEPSALAETELFSSESSENNCVDFTVTVTDVDAAPVAGADVIFSINFSGGANSGTLNPETIMSSADGTAATRYCSGSDLGNGNILASANNLSTNSDTFNVTKKGVYKLTYAESSIPLMFENETDEEGVIPLNLIDSGPQDCVTLYFDLFKSDTPVTGRELTFSTQDDPPRGVKLAKKVDPGEFVTSETTNKSKAVHTTSSSSEGRFAVPFCAGVSLGSAVVSTSFIDEDGTTITASSPVISIRGGVTNYVNFSLTFDTMNARTLKGYFNTNSPYFIETKAKVDTMQDGEAIRDYPLQVTAETGKSVLINGGRANEDGEAAFTMQAVHMVDNYAYRMFPFLSDPEAASRCNPIAIASSLGNDPGQNFSYNDLRKNWRSTVTYAIRGQEHFYDENKNGVYDGNGDGFWDKNQNGVFDGTDVLTFDANNNMTFDYSGEWFIDLPTPFVDVDENGNYDSDRDILIGDTYNAPNGERDSDTIIWKDEFFPIFMGISPYSLTHAAVNGDIDAIPATNPISSGELFGPAMTDADVFGAGATEATRTAGSLLDKFFYAQGICGNLPPGGTKVNLTTSPLSDHSYGNRTPILKIFEQAEDQYLEPSRRFLSGTGGSGGASATINFNAVNHPRKDFSYPLDFFIEIPPCTNECKGDIVSSSGGVACAPQSHQISLSVQEPTETSGDTQGLLSSISFGGARTCTCVTGAALTGDTCACPDGQSSDGTNCVAN